MPANIQTLFLAPVMCLGFLVLIPMLAHQLWSKGSVTFTHHGHPILVLRGWSASLALALLFPFLLYGAADFLQVFLMALGLPVPDWFPELPSK